MVLEDLTKSFWLLEERVGTGDTEIRRDPHIPGQAVIIAPQLEPDSVESQISTEGTPIIDAHGSPLIYKNNGNTVKVITPQRPLFLLEEYQRGLAGVGVYDRGSGIGADERFLVEGTFGTMSLELLINALVDRTKDLSTRAFMSKTGGTPQNDNSSLRQFVAYGTYLIKDSSLVGRLLASVEIAPTAQNELTQWAAHYQLGGMSKCLNCTIATQERQGTGSDSRVILYHEAPVHGAADKRGYKPLLYYDGAIAFISFAPKDQYHVHIVPFKHTSRLTELSTEQIRYLSELLYKCIISIYTDAQEMGRDIRTLEFSFHSLPFFGRNDRYMQRNGGAEVERYSHFYAQILPGQRNAYEIPGSGWLVVSGEKPKETAKRLREIINK